MIETSILYGFSIIMGNRCIETWNAEAAECGPGCFCAEATHCNRIVFLNLTLLLSGMLPLNLYVREATLYETRRGGLTGSGIGRWSGYLQSGTIASTTFRIQKQSVQPVHSYDVNNQ